MTGRNDKLTRGGGRCAVNAVSESGGNDVPPSSRKGNVRGGGRCAVNAVSESGGNDVPPSRKGEFVETGGRRAVGAIPPSRKRPAHMPLVYRGNRTAIVFLTVCTDDRKNILAKREIHELVVGAWKKAGRWMVGRYTIMPDYIHLFCSPATFPPAESVRQWVKYWKSLVAKEWPERRDQPIWQQDCWDTQLRRGESYAAKWEYVRNNPVRKGLVTAPEEWLYQGELNVLTWHEE